MAGFTINDESGTSSIAFTIIPKIKQRDYRPQLLVLARYYARKEAKDRIRAAGRKISHYVPQGYRGDGECAAVGGASAIHNQSKGDNRWVDRR